MTEKIKKGAMPEMRFLIPVLIVIVIWVFPHPAAIHILAWHMLALFVATIKDTWIKLRLTCLRFNSFSGDTKQYCQSRGNPLSDYSISGGLFRLKSLRSYAKEDGVLSHLQRFSGKSDYFRNVHNRNGGESTGNNIGSKYGGPYLMDGMVDGFSGSRFNQPDCCSLADLPALSA